MRGLARVALTLLLIVSLGFGAFNLWNLWHSPAGAWLVTRTEQEAAARLERLLAREATPERIGARLKVLLAENPRDWAAIDALETLAKEQKVILPDDVGMVLGQAYEEDHTLIIVLGKCISCAWDPANCDLSGIVLCNVTVSLTPFGDLASVIRESGHYVAGAPVDDIDLALSAIGLGAVAIVPLTGGSSLLLKTGAGMARTAYRIGALSVPVLAAARRAAGTVAYLGALGEVKAATNVVDTLRLVRGIDGLDDARRMSLAARGLGPRTTGAVELVGKSRVFRAVARWSDEVYALIASAVTLIVAVFGLILSVAKSLTFRWLRRTARQGPPPAA